MSLHVSVVSIQGDHLSKVPSVLEELQYSIEKSFVVNTGDRVAQELEWRPERHRLAKAAYLSNGWTYILDPELVLFINDIWLKKSNRWDSMVFGWVCEGASGTYGITVFDSGIKQREIFSVAGTIVSDIGHPLEQESEINWNDVFETDILALAAKIGAEFDYLADRDYRVYQLDESKMTAP